MTQIASSSYANLADAVKGEQAKWTVPGIAVGVLKDGKMSFLASGTLNVETGAPVATGSIFQIGSISKVFTATAVMRLVEAGKIDLDAPLSTYLPDITLSPRESSKKLTMRHMLDHMSGVLGDHFPDEGRGDDALERAIAGIGGLEPVTEPDVAWSYCNLGFLIAGRVIEAVTGKTYEQVMEDDVFSKLKLSPITFFPEEAILHSAAAGHITEAGGNSVARPYPISRCSNAAGGIVTSTENLLKFAQFHIGDGTVDGEQVLSPESLAEMQKVHATIREKSYWGLGWAIEEIGGVKTINHGGSTNGHQAQLTVVPEKGSAIAVLTNGSRGGAANRAIVAWALANDLELSEPDPQPIELPDAQVERLLGRYHAPLTHSTIKRGENGLVLELVSINPFSGESRPAQSFAVAPIAANRLMATEGALTGIPIDFIDSDAGSSAPPAFARIGLRLAARQ
jgi:CubicO group peptidase (beta-lactamase class C family)